MYSLQFISQDLSPAQGAWEQRSLIENIARWKQSMSHLPLQSRSPWFLLSDVSNLIGFSTPWVHQLGGMKLQLWMLWLCSLLLAMLQGAIAISQTQVCVV